MEEAKDKSSNSADQELAKLTKQCQEYLDGWKRAKADFINYKKDEAKRFSQIASFSNQALIGDLLPTLDSFELAIDAALKDENYRKGLSMIYNQLMSALEKAGVRKIKVKKGDDFDSNYHEALEQIDAEDSSLIGKVVEVLVAGYTFNDQVIRTAKVNVGKNK